MTLRWRLVAYVLSAYLVLLAVTWAMQRSLLYPAPPPRKPAVLGATVIELTAPSGAKVFALHKPAMEGRPTVVHFHGNGEQLADSGLWANLLGGHGIGLYTVEYPGYGLAASGTPGEGPIYEAAETAIRHLEADLKVPRERIAILGQSIGSGAAVEMALRGYGTKLVLISPFTTLRALAGEIFPFLPAGFILRDKFDNLGKAPKVKQPALVIHGVDDEIIPVAQGKELASRFGTATLELLPGVHHNDILSMTLGERVAKFLMPPAKP
jgi:pimeloyl-ACP methyl ester carboxylesterase